MNSILDTNVLIRFFVGDNKKQQNQAKAWFKEAEEGKLRIAVPTIVVAETAFVLESFYKKKRQDIAEVLEVFLSQRWLQVEERDVVLNALKQYRKGEHFVDSFIFAWASLRSGEILSFDQKLKRKQ